MNEKNSANTEAKMLIRKPVAQVFEAFIDPAITTNFWFTSGSDKLEVNKKVTWEWEMYGVSTLVDVKEIVPNKKIIIEWADDPGTKVEFKFEQRSNDSTYLIITEWGYEMTGEKLLAKIKDSTGGFTTVLDGLKAFLEHGINLNLVADKFPDKIKDEKYA
jgi:uncharacterized protein YndB with AHSA1/START domain